MLALVIVGGVIYSPPQIIGVVLGIFLIIAGWEWAALARVDATPRRLIFTLLVAALAGLLWFWDGRSEFYIYVCAVGVFWWILATAFVVLAQRQKLGPRIHFANRPVIGVLVLSVAWSAVVWLLLNDTTMLLGLFYLVWIADAAAFFVGRRWGRRRLASNLSPGKSWEGAAGGLAFATLGAIFFASLLELPGRAVGAFVIVAMITVCASVVGDLFESVLKRNTGLKDSGQILPGHGGVLDRIDGFVAAAPVFVAGLHGWVDQV